MNLTPKIKFGQRKHLRASKEQAYAELVREAQYLVRNARFVGITPSKLTDLRRALIVVKLATR